MSKQTDLLNLTDAITVDSSNNVGIGTDSPQRPLHVDGAEGVARFTSTASGNNGFEVGIGASSQAFLWQSENSYMHFATNNTERMRIDASGRVTMPYQPAFHARRSNHMTSTGYITFDVVNRNIGGHYDSTTGRFTAPTDGTYLFSFSTLLYSMNSSSSVALHVNGSEYYGMSALGTYGSFTGDYAGQGGTVSVGLSANDYVHLYFSRSATNLHGNYTFWSGHLIG